MDHTGVTAENWLLKAAEARTKAERMRTSCARSIMLEEAATYELLAQRAKVRLLGQGKTAKAPLMKPLRTCPLF
jgi:hypothetical protein